jgi:ABC-type multidrug transport system fused ATPase/permease subunit
MKHLFRLGPFLKPFILQISLSLLLLLLLTAIGLIVPTIIRQVIDFGIMQTQTSYLVISSIVLLGIGLLRALLNYAQRYLSEWIASHIGFDLRNRLYNHIQHLPFSFHDHSQSGQLISRCIEDVRAIERFAGFGVLEIVRIALLMVGITILLFVQQPRLATIAVIPLIPLLLLTFDFGKRIGKLFYKVDEALGALSAHLQENVIGVQVVRAFAREKFETSRFAEKNRHLYYARLTVMKNWSKIMPTSNLLVSLCTILILWFGGQMVIQGKMTVGEIVAFNAYLLMLAGPVQQLAWLVNSVGEADAGAQRSLEILDLRLEIQTPPDAITLGTLSGKVVFNNVDFQYLGESVAALKGIDFSIILVLARLH